MGTLQPVLLCADVATATDADECEAPFYFFIRLSKSIVHNSEVLAGLPAGPGFAELSTGVANDDFWRWFNQVPDSAPEATKNLVQWLKVRSSSRSGTSKACCLRMARARE